MSKNKLKESIFILKVVTFDCINVVYAQLIYRSEIPWPGTTKLCGLNLLISQFIQVLLKFSRF